MFAFLLSLRKLLTLAGATDVLGAGNEADISNIEADAADIITEVIATNAAAAATTTTTLLPPPLPPPPSYHAPVGVGWVYRECGL